MKIETVEIAKINPAPYNPRKDLKPGDSEYEKLKKSITEFDMVEPLVWNVRSGNLVGGHQRLKILQARGDDHVDVSVVDLDDTKEKALNLALNKISGEWDDGKLSALLGELSAIPELDIELTGFDLDEVSSLNPQEIVEDDFDVDAAVDAIEEPVTKLGDIILLGRHRLMCGDSTDEKCVTKLMNGQKADMVFTDPPYGVSYADKNKMLNAIAPANRIQTPIKNDHLTVTGVYDLWVAAFAQMEANCKEGFAYYVCSPQGGELMMMMMKALYDSGVQVKHTIIWVKNNIVIGRSDYHYKHEPILYGWGKGSHQFYGGRTKHSVWNFNKPHVSKLHPTMKPIELIVEAVHNSSKSGDIVYDLFIGSGSTLIACEQINRVCYGMELDPKYCDVSIQRWEEFTGQKAMRQ